jgi:hypothetical protein
MTTQWTNETTTTLLDMPIMTTNRRKRIAGPSLPTDPAKRIQQVRAFTRDLSDNLYDCDHHDVYDSIYFQRVQDIMVDTVFDDQTASIGDMGRHILDTRATSVKLYIAFFNAILAYLDTI